MHTSLFHFPELRARRGGKIARGWGPGGFVLPTDPTGPTQRVQWSDSVPQILGANVHLNQASTWAYMQAGNKSSANQMIIDHINDVGIRLLRDVMPVGNTAFRARCEAIYRATGAKFIFCVQPTSFTGSTVANVISEIQTYHLEWTAAVEGQNEYNLGTNTYANVLACQKELYNAFKDTCPVLPPGMGYNGKDVWSGRDFSAYCTHGNLHSYQGGNKPSTQLSYFLTTGQNEYGNKRVYHTETGYNTATAYYGGNPGIPESVQAIYWPVMLCEQYLSGGLGSIAYELLDDRQNNAADDNERRFGHVASWGNATAFANNTKPAKTSMTNFINLLEDPGTAYTPIDLAVTVTSSGTDMKWFPVGKRDGTYYIVAWRDVSLYTPNKVNADKTTTAGSAVVPADKTITVTLGAAVTKIEQYQPHVSATPINTVNNSATSTVTCKGGVTVFKITGAPAVVNTTYTANYGETY